MPGWMGYRSHKVTVRHITCRWFFLIHNNSDYHFTAVVQKNLHLPASPVKNWKILLEQLTFVAHLLLLTSVTTFRLEKTCYSSHWCLPPPFPQRDIIGAMVIVWRARGKIIRSVLCSASIVCNSCTQWTAHTHMNRPNSSLDWVLPHWAHFTVLRFIFVYILFCVWLYIACMCSILTWWGGSGGIEAWSLGPLLP